MELTVSQILNDEPEPFHKRHFTKRGLLNSNYKFAVKASFKGKTSKLFNLKQKAKSFNYQYVNPVSAILKLSIFTAVLLAIF